MGILYHKRALSDACEAADYYDTKSEGLGDAFIAELENAILAAGERPERNPPHTPRFRRCNLKVFPYHFYYEIHVGFIRVVVIKHNNRNPAYGIRRK